VPRPDKVAKVDEVRKDLDAAAATLLTHYRGLTVPQMAELRVKLREANAEMRIVKNTLTRRAASDAGIDGLEDLLVGPTGLVFCAEDPVGPAKAIKAFQKDHPELVLRGGYLDGEVLDEHEAIGLADLDSREDLLAKLAGLMQGALSGTARLLQAATEKQARLMQALVDAGGVEARGFSPSGAAAPTTEDTSSPTEDAPAEDTAAEAAPQAAAAVPDAPADDAPAEDEAAPATDDDQA
jgi:large subunit ribosomal protein L10